MGNLERAAELIDRLRAVGVREYCVCAGSRNTPLLAVLGLASDLRLYSFVDERSAGFFALGRIKLHGAPVAVVTTSGTAVAELLPATVEAHYAGLPLIVLSADRPARYRGTGAPRRGGCRAAVCPDGTLQAPRVVSRCCHRRSR